MSCRCRFSPFTFIAVTFATAAQAEGLDQADRLITARVLPWAMLVGAAWCGVQMVLAFVALSNGDPDAKGKIIRSAIGAVGCAGGAGLMALIIGWVR